MKTKGALVVLAVAALAASIIVGVSAQGPPQLPIRIQGNVVYGNDTRVPAGWLVTATDITASVELGNNITDLPPSLVIPQYKILVDPSQIIVGHEIKAWVSNGDWYGEATHTVQTGENDPGHVITMPDIVVSMNAPPTITVETPSGKQCGDVEVNYTLMDENSDACSIEVEYKGGSQADWAPANVSGQITDLTSSSGGENHSIIWRSKANIPGEDAYFQVRITPSDNETPGAAGTTADFEVDNKAPTILFVPPTPAHGAEVQVNYVLINVSIADNDVGTVWLNWNKTIIPPGPGGAGVGALPLAVGLPVSYTFNVTGLTPGSYTYTVFANDTSACSNTAASATRTVTVNLTKRFELELEEGWNLISIPLSPADASLNAVFPDASDGDTLYAYDGGYTTATYYSALPGWWGDFDTIELDKGYWYDATTAYTATIEGLEAGPRNVSIAADWNLLGYARLTEAGLDDLIPNANNLDEVQAYDSGTWILATYYSALPGWYGDFSTMQPGTGYWYHANAPFTWMY